MWSAIGRATARQVRVGGGRLAIRSASRLAVHSAPRTAPIIPSGTRVAAVFARGLAAAAGRPRKTTKTEDSAATKKAAAKKPASKKAPAKTAGKKTTAKAKAPAEKKKKKAVGRPRVPLTEEQKTRLKIRELRKKALLKEEPRDLPNTPWMIVLAERTKAMQADPTFKLADVARKAAAEYKAMSAAELEKLEAVAQQNKVANEIRRKNWVDSCTVQQIHEANLARNLLRRKYGIPAKYAIPDSRFPTKNLTAYISHFKARSRSPEFQGIASPQEKLKVIADEWKQLDAEGRKPFEEMAAVDLARYMKEMDEYRQGAAQK